MTESSASQLPDIGPGCLKPNRGRGGVSLPPIIYIGEDELNVSSKKGKPEVSSNTKTTWSDVI